MKDSNNVLRSPVDHLSFLQDQCGQEPVIRELLRDLQRFFTLIQQIRNEIQSDWLTVEDIAKELKISKSIVYRLIRTGQLEAINIVENQSGLSSRGHYRIHRTSLDKYTASVKITGRTHKTTRRSRSRRIPNLKNRLGL